MSRYGLIWSQLAFLCVVIGCATYLYHDQHPYAATAVLIIGALSVGVEKIK